MKRIVLFIIALSITSLANAQQLAFPGAEGFGAYASGGRGGNVVHVTNLNAAGSGSLAEAAAKAGSFIVFDVGGVIDITGKSITIASNVTIAGQTAPGGGITIYGGRVIASNSKNVIIRYIRMRGGKSVNEKKCTLTLDNCENLIMDHCSVSWGPWDNVHIVDANNITWSNCIISEGIDPQRFGSITDGTRNWTVHHCLWADNKSRNPKMKCYIQYYNNVVYNYANGVVGGHSAADNYQDLMNNYFIAGPSGSNKYFDQWTETDHMYSSGNYFDGNCDGVLNGSLVTDHHSATAMSKPSLTSTAPMNLETAQQAYYSVVEHVGASRVRDSHDLRIIDQLTSLGKKGAFIANEDELGGIGSVANGPKPTDSDNDGMADDWERANGMTVGQNDANGYAFGNGYTNIENYVNSLAQKTAFLMPPTSAKAELTNATTVKLTWNNPNTDKVTAVVVEQSENGKKYYEIKRLAGSAKTTTVNDLQAGKVYYFRMKFVGDDLESLYSTPVAVNDEYMREGGGTPPGTTSFVPLSGKLYRIINYATVPYNSGTTLSGVPKYLTFTADGALGTTETFKWDDPAIAWEIIPAEGGVYIRNYATQTYIATVNSSIGGVDKIGSTTKPAVLTINYTEDQQPAQAGTYGNVSLFRINTTANGNYQIRARGFADDWFWGSGTLGRADMVFTFAEIDEIYIKLTLTKLNSTIDSATKLAREAQTDVTAGYPSDAFGFLMDAINEANEFKENIDENTSQEEVDAAYAKLYQAINEFKTTMIYEFRGYSTDLAYNIYSYGVSATSSNSVAKPDVPRRYLVAVKGEDGQPDQLEYKIGLADNDIDNGQEDPLASDPAALWALKDAGNDFVYVVNQATGKYLQVQKTLTDSPVAVRPYFANVDNGKNAFFIYADETESSLFGVGKPNEEQTGGEILMLSFHADRTRMRWVIEETGVDVTVTGIRQINNGDADKTVRIYNLQGILLHDYPQHGMYIEQTIDSDGNVKTRKLFVK